MIDLNRLKVLVVEDDALIAQDIVETLCESGHCPIGPAYDLETARRLLRENPVQIALLDIHLEGNDDGILLSLWIKEEFYMPVVFLTAYSDYVTLTKVKKVHPEHFLVKPFNKNQLIAALEITASNFYNPVPGRGADSKVARFNQHIGQVLTRREADVLSLVYQGLNNRQIAEELFVSVNTVKTHLKSIFVKTASSDRPALMGKLHKF